MTTEEENALICERLLGWIREECYGHNGRSMGFVWKRGERDYPGWKTFTSWADAGLILDALADKYPVAWKTDAGWHAHFDHEWEFTAHPTGPLAIRAAALEYIRSLP
jgi:hypothetical protein